MNICSKFKYLFAVIYFTCAVYNYASAIQPDSLSIRDDEFVRIDSIKVTGNETTQEYIIMRELTFKVGETVSGKTLRFNRERVYSLRLFNHVNFQMEEEANLNKLIIDVSETWYIYPIPLLHFQNGDYSKSTYGVNIVYKNFRGRNETLRAAVGLGYDPFYSLAYDNPALDYKSGLGFSFMIFNGNISNKSTNAITIAGEDYSNKMILQNLIVSKRFDQFNLGYFSLGYNYIETPFARYGITASGNRIDRNIYAGLGYYYDSRDLKQYSESGLYAFTSFTYNGIFNEKINYNIFEIDFREYRNIVGNLSGKWRINYRKTFGGVVPYYDYSFLGYTNRVRGHFNDIREGKNYLLTSLELSYPVVREFDFSLKLPLIPEQLTSARIGIYLTSFYDTGDAFDNESSLSLKNMYYGYGFGVTFLILPYYALRFEYAFNGTSKGEFIIATGFSF